MKIIDLLNKIANGEEVPKQIKYRDWLYEFEKDCNDYMCQYDSLLYILSARASMNGKSGVWRVEMKGALRAIGYAGDS